MAEMLSGGEMLIRALHDVGVEYVFGYPGGAALHIYDAIFKQQAVEHVLVRHEQAATHMADGYARSTGEPGVVLVTSGPGATNAITGLATAYMDSIPLVVISGQVPHDVIGTDAFQETDMIGVSRPVVKHSYMIQEAEQLPHVVKEAVYIATSGRRGPVVIDIPKDTTDPNNLFEYHIPDKIELRSYKPAERGHYGQVKRATKALLESKRPVIYAGGGVIQGDAAGELTTLARRLNYPVTNTLMGLGAFPGSDQQFLGMLGMHGTYEANNAMHHADMILAVGARFDDRVTNNPEKFCPDATVIHVDVDPASISKVIAADIPIVGQCKAVLSQILDCLDEEMQTNGVDREAVGAWWNQVNTWRGNHGLDHNLYQQESASGKLLPQQVVQMVYQATKGEAFVTSDVGQHQMFAAQYYKFDEPRKWVNSGGLGTMGFGLPSAMGVQFAHPHATVVCITGEGSFMMNMQELSTCSQYSLPIKIVNLNNQALGMVKQWQDMQYGGRHSHSTYADSLPDFVSLIRSFGHVGIRAESLQELNEAVELAFSDKHAMDLVFIDAIIDPDEHIYPMFVKGGAVNDMVLKKHA
ncbi:MAG: acetolactate synthase 3 large subunit [Gammaproteobacteria bacterium]|nr:acetolactate synthase 3 large subunit [Gammaproteobacteria bacterium]